MDTWPSNTPALAPSCWFAMAAFVFAYGGLVVLRETLGADLPAAVSIFACLQTRPPPEAPSTPRRARRLL